MSGAWRFLTSTTFRVLALAMLAGGLGCQGGAPKTQDSDPLLGGTPLPRTSSGAVPTRRDSSAQVRGEVPPIPPANSTRSPAALTLGEVAPSGDRRTPATGVTLHGPRAREGKESGSTTAPSASTSNPALGSYESVQEQLRARGVVWQQLRQVENEEWHFICAIPDPRQGNLRRNYEARAVGRHGLAAIQAVLEEIDRDQR